MGVTRSWIVLVAIACFGAEPPQLRTLTELASAVPPEYAADALIHGIQDVRPEKLDPKLLNEVFDLASRARIQSATTQPARPLDRISLQTAVVRLALPQHPKLARELLARITVPAASAAGCSATFVDDWSALSTLTAEVAQRAFTRAEKADGKHIQLYREYLDRVTAPSQLKHADLGANPDERQQLAYSLAGALDRLNVSDVVFTQTLSPLNSSVVEEHDAVANTPAALELAGAWRRYLKRHLEGTRCSAQIKDQAVRARLQAVADVFNGKLASRDDARAAAIDLADWKPASIEESQAPALPASNFEAEWLNVMFDGGGRSLSEKAKQSAEWIQKFDSFAARITDEVQQPGESDSAFFLRKGNALKMAALAAPDRSRGKLIGSFTAFLKDSRLRLDHPPVWSLMAVSALDGFSTQSVMEAYEASGDPILILYAALHKFRVPRAI